jgi:hypothetical protein
MAALAPREPLLQPFAIGFFAHGFLSTDFLPTDFC